MIIEQYEWQLFTCILSNLLMENKVPCNTTLEIYAVGMPQN